MLRVPLFKKTSAAKWLLLILSTVFAAYGQDAKPVEVRELAPGQTSERRMNGEETHSYKVGLQRGEFLQVRVEQRSVDLSLALYSQSGKMLAAMDNPGFREGVEILSFGASVAGDYVLQVKSQIPVPVDGGYAISREASKATTAKDRKRVSVEKLFVAATASQDSIVPRENALGKLSVVLTASRELKSDHLIELTLGQMKRRADHIARNAFSFFRQTPTDLRASIERIDEARRLFSMLGDKEGEARVLNQTAEAFETLGENQKALENLNEALPLIIAAGNNEGRAAILHGIGEAYSNLGEKQKALDRHLEAQPFGESLGEKNLQALSATLIGKAYFDLGDNQKAIEQYNRALRIIEEISNKRGHDKILVLLGDVYLRTGEVQRAFIYYDRALQFYIDAKDKRYEAFMLNYIGIAHAASGERNKALDYYNQALLKIAGDKLGEITVLNSLGEFYSNAGDKQRALDTYDKALLLNQTVKNKELEGFTLNNAGLVYASLGQNEKAFDYYGRALALSKETGNKGLQSIALINTGFFYSSLGENQKAIDRYTEALILQKAVGNKKGEAIVLNNIGLVYAIRGEREKALDYYKRAVFLDKSLESITLNNIAGVDFTAQDYRRSLDQFDQALSLSRANGNKSAQSAALNNIGAAHSALGEKPKAIEFFNRALTLYKASGDRRGESISLNALMEAWAALDNRRLAIFYGKQSVNTLQSLRSDIKGLDKNLQQSFLGTIENTYRKLAELLIKEDRIPEAERVLRMLKEEEFFDFVNRDGRVVESLDERIKLNSTEKQTFEQHEILSLETSRIYREIEKLEIEKLTTDMGQKNVLGDRLAELNKRLEIASSKLKTFLTEIAKDLEKKEVDSKYVEESSQTVVKEWNDPQTAVISTIVGRENLSVIVTTAEFQRGYVSEFSEEKLRKLVDDFRAAVIKEGFEKSDPRPAAQELYNVLIKPIKKDLEAANVRTLVWSLDKFLRYVPVSALWDKDKGYLVQNYSSVVLALASRQNLAFRPENKRQWRALGVGVSKRAENLDPLIHVPRELEAIVRAKTREDGIIAGTRLLDEQFTSVSFRKALGTYQFTHAATHFVFISGTKAEGLNSYLLMGSGEKLTLAQVQNSDNIFSGVELLTLSACDTGYGGKTADGREIEGLGVLSQRKGARSIMATLWPVNDESTRELMVNFYTNYQKPDFNKAEALRQAQLTLLEEPDKASKQSSIPTGSKKYAHLYHWAPFILIGNWR